MLIGDQTIHKVHGFSDEQLANMRWYLLGAAHVWTRDRKDEWFAARDLLGGTTITGKALPLSICLNTIGLAMIITMNTLLQKLAKLQDAC